MIDRKKRWLSLMYSFSLQQPLSSLSRSGRRNSSTNSAYPRSAGYWRNATARLGNDLVVITPLPDGIIVEKDVMIRMPGGVSIAVNIYRPEGGGRVPVVLGLTSYGKDLKPEDYAINGRGPANRAMGTDFGDFIVSEETSFEALILRSGCPGDMPWWSPMPGEPVIPVDGGIRSQKKPSKISRGS
jgi:hypothetical protein